MKSLTGSCHCGAVQYEVVSDIKKVVNCHCNLCRRMNGSAFSTYAAVLSSDFHITKGAVKDHAVTELATKHFCGECGTPIFNTNPKYKGLYILHLGSLNNAAEIEPHANIYSDSELDWTSEVKAYPSFSEGVS